jgi:protein Tex
MLSIVSQIALEIKVRESQVKAAVDLLDGGATVPFVARYRKEATDGLDDIQLRELEFRLGYLREMAERREAILKNIESQGKLTPELHAAIEAAPTKQELEDLYLPYKQKRRTKGQIAREAGIEPLAEKLFDDPSLNPLAEAESFIQPAGSVEGGDFSNALAVLDGVRDILSERWAEDAGLVQSLREWLWSSAEFSSKLIEGKNENDAEIAKFRDYFEYSEPIAKVPSHRALAVFRGRGLEFLEAKLAVPVIEYAQNAINSVANTALKPASLAEGRIALHLGWSHAARPSDDLLRKCVSWAWKVKLCCWQRLRGPKP